MSIQFSIAADLPVGYRYGFAGYPARSAEKTAKGWVLRTTTPERYQEEHISEEAVLAWIAADEAERLMAD